MLFSESKVTESGPKVYFKLKEKNNVGPKEYLKPKNVEKKISSRKI